MYTPKHIAEAMAELFDDPKWEGDTDATTIAWCNLWDRVASETGLSEEALRQLMKEGFLLRMEQNRQMREAQEREDRQHRRIAALLGRKGMMRRTIGARDDR